MTGEERGRSPFQLKRKLNFKKDNVDFGGKMFN